MGVNFEATHCGLLRSTWAAVVAWGLLTAGLIVMLGAVEVLYLRSSGSTLFVAQPSPAASQYVATASWSRWTPLPSPLLASGSLRLDNSSMWRALVSPTPPGPTPAQAYGALRFDTFEFSWPTDSLVFLVLGTTDSGGANASYALVRCAPVGRPQASGWLGNLNAMGSFNCLFGTVLTPASPTNTFFLLAAAGMPGVLAATNNTTLQVVMGNLTATATVSAGSAWRLVGWAPLAAGAATAAPGNETLGLGSFLNQRAVLGQYADVAAFLLYVSIVLLLEVFLSLLLTAERRRNMGPFVFVAGFAVLQDLFVAVNFEAVVGAPSANNRSCLAIGSWLHLSCVGAVGAYAMASLSVFFLLFRSGELRRWSFAERPLLYAVCLAAFVLINYCIVWALRAAPPLGSLSYGPLGAWAFCWITSEWVLLGFFFVPAGLIMCVNLILSLYLGCMILSVRARSRGVTGQTVREVVGLFFAVNSGSVACGILALLFFAFSDNPPSYLCLVTSILFLLQALSLWVVFFARRENLMLWGLLLCCRWGQRQRLLSSDAATPKHTSSTPHSDAISL